MTLKALLKKRLLKRILGTSMTVAGYCAIVFLAWFTDIIVLNDTGFFVVLFFPVWYFAVYFFTKLSLKYFLI